MKPLGFDWDDHKAASNIQKHGVTFEEASEVFDDPVARVHDDPSHSAAERREIIVGRSATGRILLVSFTERRNIVRIISARPVTRLELFDYEEGKF